MQKPKKLSWVSRVWASEDCMWTFTKWVSQLHLSQALLPLSFFLETLQTFLLGGCGYVLSLPPELLSWPPASDSAGGLPACGEWTLMAFIDLFPATLILQRALSPKSCWALWPGLKGAGWRRYPCGYYTCRYCCLLCFCAVAFGLLLQYLKVKKHSKGCWLTK